MFEDDDTTNTGMNGDDESTNGDDSGTGKPAPTEDDTSAPDEPAI